MNVAKETYKTKVITLLDELPEPEIREVYHFTAFIKKRLIDEFDISDLPSVRADHLSSLLGLTELGGDALKDTEDLYHE